MRCNRSTRKSNGCNNKNLIWDSLRQSEITQTDKPTLVEKHKNEVGRDKL